MLIKGSARLDSISYSYGYVGCQIVSGTLYDNKNSACSFHGKSDGFVAFSVKTLPSLAKGTTVNNRAGIYFDVNPVVITNTVTNAIGTPLNLQQIQNTVQYSLYPNPAHNEVNIVTTEKSGQLRVTNQLGQVLIRQLIQSVTTTINTSTLPQGLYFISIHNDNGIHVEKLKNCKALIVFIIQIAGGVPAISF